MANKKLSRVKLTYFDFPGLAEPIRNAFALGGIPFEDERIPGNEVGYAEVARRRSEGKLGTSGIMPLLEVDIEGCEGNPYLLSQSSAILRFVGRHTLFEGRPMYPIDCAESQGKCDEVEEALAEIRCRMLPAWYKAAQPRSLATGKPSVPLSEEQQVQLLTCLNDDILPSKLVGLERMLAKEVNKGDNGATPFFLGTRLTTADLSCYSLVDGLLTGDKPDGVDGSRVLADTPLLMAHRARIGGLAPIQARIATLGGK